MAIVDGRTQLTANDATTGIVNEAGAATGTQNTETFIEGSASVSTKLSQTTGGLLWDAGSAQDWSSQHFYIWWNVATAGKLNTKVSGGVRMRFCGATVTDFFEVYIDGSDTYTGGFKMTVVDIERASASPDNSGGTPPATTAIRYVGMFFDVTGMIQGNFDNVFIDAMWRLPASTPGIRIEGQNTGSVDWNWQDIVDAADAGDTTKAWGSAFKRDGVIFINTPIRFGANDGVTHGFSDTDGIVGWEDQLVATTGFYKIEVIGGSSVQSFQLGTKTGSGDDAVGTQGGVILADSAGSRWDFDCDDVNIDTCNIYGTAFFHAEDFQLDNANVETISCTFTDCTSARVDNSLFLKNRVLNANTADGVAFITIDDLTDIRRCDFVFSDGHAIELTTPRVATQTAKGLTFTGYGVDDTNDAAVYNNTAGAVTINVTDNGDGPTVRNGTSASTSVVNSITLTLDTLQSSSEIRIYQTGTTTEEDGIETSGTSFDYTFNSPPGFNVDIIIHHLDFQYFRLENFTLPATDAAIPIVQIFDRNFSNP